MSLDIRIDVNVNFPGLSAILQSFLGNIMTILEDLQASTAAQKAAIESLTAKVEESNSKTDTLILIANTTKDALVALQGQSSPITAADIQAVIDAQTASVAAIGVSIASIDAQEAETDAAAVAVAP